MVLEITVKHIYKYPVEFVARTHFSKYPNDKEKIVQNIETVEKKYDKRKGSLYLKRIATCENVIPSILRKALDEDKILLEELAWIDAKKREVKLKSRNITWEKYARLGENSVYKPCLENSRWTELEQTGSIDIHGLGSLGKLIEKFAHGFLNQGTARALVIMEDLLNERAAVNFDPNFDHNLNNDRFTQSSWL